jgi:hypothetical protein
VLQTTRAIWLCHNWSILFVTTVLKTIILKHKFKNQIEEIKFFKKSKPRFLSRLIYHNAVYNIETHKPHGGEKVLRKYLNNELQKLKQYFDDNLDFYKYYRTNSEYLDYKYFVRGKLDTKLSLDSFYFETDHRFSTSHDFKVAKILSNDLLQVYLESELATLERRELKLLSLQKSDAHQKKLVFWTGSKTALIEEMGNFVSITEKDEESTTGLITKQRVDECLLICTKRLPNPIFCNQKIGCNFLNYTCWVKVCCQQPTHCNQSNGLNHLIGCSEATFLFFKKPAYPHNITHQISNPATSYP